MLLWFDFTVGTAAVPQAAHWKSRTTAAISPRDELACCAVAHNLMNFCIATTRNSFMTVDGKCNDGIRQKVIQCGCSPASQPLLFHARITIMVSPQRRISHANQSHVLSSHSNGPSSAGFQLVCRPSYRTQSNLPTTTKCLPRC